MGTPVRGPSETWPYTSALLTMRGKASGLILNRGRKDVCHWQVLRSIIIVRDALLTDKVQDGGKNRELEKINENWDRRRDKRAMR
jgi:hypothetical protein